MHCSEPDAFDRIAQAVRITDRAKPSNLTKEQVF